MRQLQALLPFTLRKRYRVEDEVFEELRFHLAMSEADLVERGMSPSEARAEALRRLGDAGAIAQACVRVHADHPIRATLLAAESAVTLMLGLGLLTALFLLLNAVFFRAPLGFHDEGRRVALWWYEPSRERFDSGSRFAEFEELRRAGTLEHTTAAVYQTVTLRGPREPETVRIKHISRDYFRLYGARTLVGRLFAPDEEEQDDTPVVLLSHALWQRQFGGRHGAVGATVEVNGVDHTIVGVMPADLPMYLNTALYAPLTPDFMRGRHVLVAGRLRDGMSLPEARSQAREVLSSAADPGLQPVLRKLQRVYSGTVRRPLLGGGIVIAFLTLAALAHLVQRRVTSAEATHLSSRVAPRTVRALEAVLIVGLAAWAGFALATPGAQWLSNRLLGSVAPLFDVQTDGRVVAVCAGLVVVVLGVQLLRAYRPSGLQRARIRPWLVGVQIAIALVLVLAATTPVTSFAAAWRNPVGFDMERLNTVDFSIADRPYEDRRQALQTLRRGVLQTHGVEAATFTQAFPMQDRYWRMTMGLDGASATDWRQVRFAVVDSGYHDVMGIPLLAGRRFDERDRPGATNVVVVNRAAVEAFGLAGHALGERLHCQGVDRVFTIVGVVENVRQSAPHAPPEPVVYRPVGQYAGAPRYTMVVRGAVSDDALTAALRAIDPALPITQPTSAQQIVSAATAGVRFRALLLGGAASVAALLALVGFVGLMLDRTESVWRSGRRPGQGWPAWRALVAPVIGAAAGGLAAGAVLAHRLTRLEVPWLTHLASMDVVTVAAVFGVVAGLIAVSAVVVAQYVRTVPPPDLSLD